MQGFGKGDGHLRELGNWYANNDVLTQNTNSKIMIGHHYESVGRRKKIKTFKKIIHSNMKFSSAHSHDNLFAIINYSNLKIQNFAESAEIPLFYDHS